MVFGWIYICVVHRIWLDMMFGCSGSFECHFSLTTSSFMEMLIWHFILDFQLQNINRVKVKWLGILIYGVFWKRTLFQKMIIKWLPLSRTIKFTYWFFFPSLWRSEHTPRLNLTSRHQMCCFYTIIRCTTTKLVFFWVAGWIYCSWNAYTTTFWIFLCVKGAH